MTASGLKLCEIMGIAVESRHTLYKELHMQGMCLHCRISVGWLELLLARRRKQKASTLCLRDHKKKKFCRLEMRVYKVSMSNVWSHGYALFCIDLLTK